MISLIKPSLEARRQIVISELLENGITTINGTSVNDVDYDTLKQELALLRFRKINIECQEAKFF
jgi:hypothetical protein